MSRIRSDIDVSVRASELAAGLPPAYFTYRTPSGTKLDVVYRPGVGLVLPGSPPAVLVPWRPHEFRMKEFPDIVFSFTTEAGRVTAMRPRDPSGESVFPRNQ